MNRHNSVVFVDDYSQWFFIEWVDVAPGDKVPTGKLIA